MMEWKKLDENSPELNKFYLLELDGEFYVGKIIEVEAALNRAVVQILCGIMKDCTIHIWSRHLEIPNPLENE